MPPVTSLPSECIAVYLAGSNHANGLYFPSGEEYRGFPRFRKRGSNVGIIRFDDRKLYISDCGPEFHPSGTDHLDFYVTLSEFRADITTPEFDVGEDGRLPVPKLRFVSKDSLRSLISALRAQGHKLVAQDSTHDAILHFSSLIELGAPVLNDYLTLARLQLEGENVSEAWTVMTALTRNNDLLFEQGVPRYSKSQRSEISTLLVRSCGEDRSIARMVAILAEKSLYPFLEFVISLCDDLKQKMDLEKFNPHAFDDASIKNLIRVAEERRAFQLAGGLEIAINLRELYRTIDTFTFDQRDTSVNRMKIFSLTDTFRQFGSDGKLDLRGRDGTFKNFWEAGSAQRNEEESSAPIDPRVQDSRIKDLDPSKEAKCSVIKAINDSKEPEETDISRFLNRRSELLKSAPNKIYSLEDIRKCDCNNSELKLISIHSIVFDVTHNLEKYAPDGEYYFFPGHDISYSLAVSSLSGDHVDELYLLERPEHLKRVYGWLEYFVNKYKIVGRMIEYDQESSWPPPPQGEEEPEMQCSIM
jgi:hypothetical protein